MKNYLSEDYLKRLDEKYLFNRDKYLSGGGRILLKYILSKIGLYNYTIATDDKGKPFLDGHTDIHFNISHCDDFVLVGVSKENIGVDIEKIQDLDYDGISNHFFHYNEHAEIVNSENPIDTFFKIWTLKEGYVKMKGTGITDLKSFMVDIESNIILDIDNNNYKYSNVKLKTWKLNSQYIIGVCSKVDLIQRPEKVSLLDIDNQLL